MTYSEAINFYSNRIVGGSNAVSGQFPYQVSLRDSLFYHFCGGSIINTRWILTSAHCIEGRTPLQLYIVTGSTLLNGGTSYRCSNIINHEKYDNETHFNDIAVVQSATTIITGTNVQPIQLIYRNIQSGTLVVSGWGSVTNIHGPTTNNLKYLYTSVISYVSCENRIKINEDSVCTLAAAGKGMCTGDSGGPLVMPGEGLVGVGSYVVFECGFGYPDVFSSVYYHRNWIIANTK